MLGTRTVAAIAALAALSPPAHAEPAHADPLFVAASGGGTPKTLSRFAVAGADISIVARGRFASIDTERRARDVEEASEMAKFMPGYPQPAFVTFDVRLSF